ncbi:MAG: zinc dependent phospholipase C family protein [Clostridia bacterium]|nr:zinc dependent phospholipase C family protein [Clostridia bacterium]
MPATYTHHLIAKYALDTLPTAVQNVVRTNLPLYFFGAQGADFCFFYRFLNPKSKNLGSFLHRKGGYTAFCTLKTLASRDLKLFTYMLGFATHYAADVTFHPFVYAQSGKSPLRHSRIEGALDIHFKRQFPLSHEYASLLHKKLAEESLNDLFLAYSAIAAKCGFPPLQKPSFLRAVSLFNAYPPITSAIFPNENSRTFQKALNEKQLPWAYPAAPIVRNDSADMLFEKAVDFAAQSFEKLMECIQNQRAPSREWFGKNYLTGI